LKAKANKRFAANVSLHAALGEFISFKVGLVPGPPWWHEKLNHGKVGVHSPTRLMGLELVVEGTRLKASSANDELKIGSWGERVDVNLSQGDTSCCPAKR